MLTERLETVLKRPVLAVFVIALIARTLTALIVYITSDGSLFLDDESYVRIAEQAASGDKETWDDYIHWVWERTFVLLGPVAGLFWLTGEFTLAGQLYLALAGAAAAGLTVKLALEFLPREWAVATGLVVALLPSQVLWSSIVLKEAVVWAIAAGIAVCVALANRRSGRELVLPLLMILVLLAALAYTRQHVAVVATWAAVVGLMVGPRRGWVLRVVPLAVLALALPAVTTELKFGGIALPGGLSETTERRNASAVDANSAIVEGAERGLRPAPDARDKEPAPDARQEEPAVEAPVSTDEYVLAPPSGDSLVDNLRYLPDGLAAYLLRPYPWEANASSTELRIASVENLVWYFLLALALVGLTAVWRHRDVLTFPLLLAGGTIVMYALTEGNLGTAFRHRGELLWVTALFAAPGARLLLAEPSRAKARALLERAAAQPAASLILIGVAAGVRLAYIAKSGVVDAGDTALYLKIGESFADGSPTTDGYPTHVLYGVLLAPAYVVGMSVDTWVTVLHPLLAAATVLLVHRTARLFAGQVGALAAGLAAALIPTAVFWSNYVLTETMFLLVLAAFIYACARVLVDPRIRFGVPGALIAALLLMFSRPVGLAIALVGLSFVLWAVIQEKGGARRARLAVVGAAAAVLIVIGGVFAIPPSRDAVFSNATFTVSLWNSTRIWHSDLAHVERGIELPADMRGLSDEDRLDEQRERAWDYISEQPGEYAVHAGVRFTSFWFPWASATWGNGHKLYDALISFFIVALAIYALLRPPSGRGRRVVLLLASLALAQGLLVGVSQIDSEARYRLPAELTLLPLLALPVDRFFTRRKPDGALPA